MFCSKCGHQNPDAFSFCQKCGNKLVSGGAPAVDAAPAVSAQVESAPAVSAPAEPATPVYAEAAPAPFAATPAAPKKSAAKFLKSLLISPWFIVASVSMSFSVILNLINYINNFEIIKAKVYSDALYNIVFFDFLELTKSNYDQLSSVYNSTALSAPAAVVLIIVAVLGIALAAGLIASFVSAVLSRENRINPYGFITLKVTAVIKAVFIVLGLIGWGGYAFYRAFFLYVDKDGYDNSYMRASTYRYLFVVFAILTVAVLMYILIAKTLNELKMAGRDLPAYKASILSAVVMISYAGIQLLRVCNNFGNYIYMASAKIDGNVSHIYFSYMEYYFYIDGTKIIAEDMKAYICISSFATLFSAVALICLAVLMFKYRYLMKALHDAENQ